MSLDLQLTIGPRLTLRIRNPQIFTAIVQPQSNGSFN